MPHEGLTNEYFVTAVSNDARLHRLLSPLARQCRHIPLHTSAPLPIALSTQAVHVAVSASPHNHVRSCRGAAAAPPPTAWDCPPSPPKNAARAHPPSPPPPPAASWTGGMGAPRCETATLVTACNGRSRCGSSSGGGGSGGARGTQHYLHSVVEEGAPASGLPRSALPLYRHEDGEGGGVRPAHTTTRCAAGRVQRQQRRHGCPPSFGVIAYSTKTVGWGWSTHRRCLGSAALLPPERPRQRRAATPPRPPRPSRPLRQPQPPLPCVNGRELRGGKRSGALLGRCEGLRRCREGLGIFANALSILAKKKVLFAGVR